MTTNAKGLTAEWFDRGDFARNAPDPRYPYGIDVDLSRQASASCRVELDYPAPRCGQWLLLCNVCGLSAVVTTAGRADDPRSVRVACKRAS